MFKRERRRKISFFIMFILVVLLFMFLFPKANAFIKGYDKPHNLPYDKSIYGFKLTSGFWDIRGKHAHRAWDLSMVVGTPIYANMDGKVETGINKKAGAYVTILNNRSGDAYEVDLFHLSKFHHGNLADGQVKFGELVGWSGNSGRTSGPHLHFQIKKNGKKVYPQRYMHYAAEKRALKQRKE